MTLCHSHCGLKFDSEVLLKSLCVKSVIPDAAVFKGGTSGTCLNHEGMSLSLVFRSSPLLSFSLISGFHEASRLAPFVLLVMIFGINTDPETIEQDDHVQNPLK